MRVRRRLLLSQAWRHAALCAEEEQRLLRPSANRVRKNKRGNTRKIERQRERERDGNYEPNKNQLHVYSSVG